EDRDLQAALYYNRQLWTIFLGSVSDVENPLPIEIKNNIASLGIFVLNHTIDIQVNPTPEKLASLININRDIASGLHNKA
ncbi:MAG: flagellar biosynthesis regulator FlaF, partial [Desulfobulbia bacterium]